MKNLVEEYQQHKDSQNPILKPWRVFSVIIGLFSLASATEQLVKWEGFILLLIETYRLTFHPVIGFLLSWIDIDFSPLFYDYLSLGILVGGAYIRAIRSGERAAGFKSKLPSRDFKENLRVTALAFQRVLYWLLFLATYAYAVLVGFDQKAEERFWWNYYERRRVPMKYMNRKVRKRVVIAFAKHIGSVKVFQWLVLVLFLLLVLLTVNITILKD